MQVHTDVLYCEKELVRIKQELTDEKTSNKKKIVDLQNKFTITESELQRAYMAKAQAHELLVQSKTMVSEQESFIKKLKVCA